MYYFSEAIKSGNAKTHFVTKQIVLLVGYFWVSQKKFNFS